MSLLSLELKNKPNKNLAGATSNWSLLGLFFGPDDGIDMIHQNVDWAKRNLIPKYGSPHIHHCENQKILYLNNLL
jgi:hypothetical protein